MEPRTYLEALDARVRGELGPSLVAVALVGSAGAGWYEPGVSDIDVAVVVKRALDEPSARSLAARLSHSELPCPARKLELVVYRRDLLAKPKWPLPFELNLNTGEGTADHVGLDASAEAAHWFLLDLAIARERSTPLSGPPLHALLGEIPRPAVLEALGSALDWYDLEEPDHAASILAACRAWHYAEEGEWASKREAAEWAAERLPHPGPVHRALTLRGGGTAEFPSGADAAGVVARARSALNER
jgi:predicted nucleotidyltransferase